MSETPEPVDDPRYYPDFTELMKAPQDVGAVNPKSKTKEFKFKKLERFCTSYGKMLMNKKFPNIPNNQTRVKKNILDVVLRLRKKLPKCQLDSQFHMCANDDGMVHVFQNDTVSYGFNVVVAALANFWDSLVNKRENARTPSEALRLMYMMLRDVMRPSTASFLT